VSLLLHAISPKPEQDEPAGPGLRGLPLIRVDEGALSAWATLFSSAVPTFTRDDVMEDHRVVNFVFERVSACLPARFPTVVEEGVLRGGLATRAEHLERQLELVQGACELAVTAVWSAREELSTDVDAETPGRRYLLRRQAALAGSERRHARASELADVLESLVGPGLRQAQRQVCPSAEVALSLALLVERDVVDDVRVRLSLYSALDVRILVHGPWPPYSFAT
jgi:hypothetical protein